MLGVSQFLKVSELRSATPQYAFLITSILELLDDLLAGLAGGSKPCIQQSRPRIAYEVDGRAGTKNPLEHSGRVAILVVLVYQVTAEGR